jgi:spore germination protein KB
VSTSPIPGRCASLTINNEQISAGDLFWIIFAGIGGIAHFHISREAWRFFGNEGWLGVALAGLVAGVAFIPLYLLVRRFPEESPVGYTTRVLGKYPGKAVMLLYLLDKLVFLIVVLRTIGEVVSTTILPNTPRYVVVGLVAAVAVYAAFKGVESVARLIRGLIYPVLFLLEPLYYTGFRNWSVTNLLPVLSLNLAEYLQGIGGMLYLYNCAILVYYYYPFVKREEKKYAHKAAPLAVAATTLTYVGLTAAIVATFSLDAGLFVFPVTAYVRTINVPLLGLERITSFYVVFIIVLATTATASFDLAISMAARDLFGLKDKWVSRFCVILGATAVIAGSVPISLNWILDNLVYLGYPTVLMNTLIPLIILFVAWLRRLPSIPPGKDPKETTAAVSKE